MAGMTSLFVRGGNSAANRVVLDGVPIENIGGVFDYSTLATTGIKSFEIYRGANSTLYGSDAAAGVVNLETPRGTTSFPSLLYEGDAGNFHTYRNAVQAGGTWHKLDYYGGFDALRSSNALPQNEYHLNTETVNLGYAISSATSLRVTARNADAAVGLPARIALPGWRMTASRATRILSFRHDREPDDGEVAQPGALWADAQAGAERAVVSGGRSDCLWQRCHIYELLRAAGADSRRERIQHRWPGADELWVGFWRSLSRTPAIQRTIAINFTSRATFDLRLT